MYRLANNIIVRNRSQAAYGSSLPAPKKYIGHQTQIDTKISFHPTVLVTELIPWTTDATNGNDNTIPNIHCSKFTTFNKPYSVTGMAHPL